MKWQKYLLPSIIFAILAIFVVYPVLSVLVKSLSVKGQASLDNYIAAFTQPQFYSTIWGSVLVAIGAAVLSTLLGDWLLRLRYSKLPCPCAACSALLPYSR